MLHDLKPDISVASRKKFGKARCVSPLCIRGPREPEEFSVCENDDGSQFTTPILNSHISRRSHIQNPNPNPVVLSACLDSNQSKVPDGHNYHT